MMLSFEGKINVLLKKWGKRQKKIAKLGAKMIKIINIEGQNDKRVNYRG